MTNSFQKIKVLHFVFRDIQFNLRFFYGILLHFDFTFLNLAQIQPRPTIKNPYMEPHYTYVRKNVSSRSPIPKKNYLNRQPATMAEAPASPAKKAPKKPAVKPAHPPYAVMIAAAIKALKERGGSSRQAILKYILANYKVADAAKAQVRAKLAIRKMLEAKTIIPVKGSFKLPKEEKVVKPKKAKKPAAKKPAKKKAAAKKPAAKKAKKPAAKKAKKPAAAKKPAKKAAKKPAAKKPAAKKAAKKPAAKKAAKK